MPGKSVSYTFSANDPGVFMYHCGTKPVLMHIANGMYGAIVVEPNRRAAAGRQELRPRRQRVVPRLGRPDEAREFDMAKAHARQPDWMTFNGYAGQYVKHPLTAEPGELVRFWVVDAGPVARHRLPHRRHGARHRVPVRRHEPGATRCTAFRR